jgi:hypothetical protein
VISDASSELLDGEIVGYEHAFMLCYVRGPEGLIVEPAQPVAGPTG